MLAGGVDMRSVEVMAFKQMRFSTVTTSIVDFHRDATAPAVMKFEGDSGALFSQTFSIKNYFH